MLLMQSIEDVTKVAEGNYTTEGILLVMLLGIIYMLYRTGAKVLGWCGIRVDQAIDRGFKHLDTVDATMTSLKESIGGINSRFDNVESKVDTLGNRFTRLEEHITRRDD